MYSRQTSSQYGGCSVLYNTRIKQRYFFYHTMTECVQAIPTANRAILEISSVQFSILVVQIPYLKERVSDETLTWHMRRPVFNPSATGNGK